MAEIGSLKRSLEPVTDMVIATALKALIQRGWRFPDGIDPSRAVELYAEVLVSKGAGPIRAVTEKMIKGEYDICEKAFLPVPSAFARLCDTEHAAIRSKIMELKRADRRRLVIWNRLPDSWNNRQREEHIDRVLAELDGVDLELAAEAAQ